jgi:hypothetical protein
LLNQHRHHDRGRCGEAGCEHLDLVGRPQQQCADVRAGQAIERTTTAVASTLSEASTLSLSGSSSDPRKVVAAQQLPGFGTLDVLSCFGKDA